MKLFILFLAIAATLGGALHSVHERKLFVRAALMSEGFDLTDGIKLRVQDYFDKIQSMPEDNSDIRLPPPDSMYGAMVQRIRVVDGELRVDFDQRVDHLEMRFTPEFSVAGEPLKWHCSSATIDADILEKLEFPCALRDGSSYRATQTAGAVQRSSATTGAMARADRSNTEAALWLDSDDLLLEAAMPAFGSDAYRNRLYLELRTAAETCHPQRLITLLRDARDYGAPVYIDDKPITRQLKQPSCQINLNQFLQGKKSYQQALASRLTTVIPQCNVEATSALLRDNPGVDVLALVDGVSHLERAVRAGCVQSVGLLIRNKGLTGKMPETTVATAIEYAPGTTQVQLVGRLIAAGADVAASLPGGDAPLTMAIQHGQPVVAKFILDAGADVNVSTTSESTPLIEASKQGFQHLVGQLINRGADVNARDSLGRTPLLAAVARGRHRLVEMLLRSGADASLRDDNGIDALLLADIRNYRQIKSILLSQTR